MNFPLLGWSAELHDDYFMLLDESQLPESVSFIRIENYMQAVSAIREMKTRAFGQLLTVLYALALTARKAASTDNLAADITDACDALKSSRPTFSFSFYTDLVIGWANDAVWNHLDTAADMVVEHIHALLDTIKAMRMERAELAASLFEDGDVILTHCNTSGELLLIARKCREQGKQLVFYATETRPYFQGRLTTWEMSRDGFDITLIPDNRAVSIFNDGCCTKVITGADRVALNGDVVNKTGTSQLAMLAHEFGVPFYVLVQEPGKTETGDDVTIEYRAKEEVTAYKGKPIYPIETEAFYPAFDVTSHTYIDKLVTFGKILTPADLPAGWNINT